MPERLPRHVSDPDQIMSLEKRIERSIALLGDNHHDHYLRLREIRQMIAAYPDRAVRLGLSLQLFAMSGDAIDLDVAYKLCERLNGGAKDKALADIVAALLALGRYHQAGVRARQVGAPSIRSRLLSEICVCEAVDAKQRRSRIADEKAAAVVAARTARTCVPTNLRQATA
jgi:hypothetical protein